MAEDFPALLALAPEQLISLIKVAMKVELEKELRSALSAQDHCIGRLERLVEEQRGMIDTLRAAMHKRFEFVEGWVHRHRGQEAHPVGLLPDMMPQVRMNAPLASFGPAPRKLSGQRTHFVGNDAPKRRKKTKRRSHR